LSNFLEENYPNPHLEKKDSRLLQGIINKRILDPVDLGEEWED